MWGETLKKRKMRNTHCRNRDMARKLKNVEHEKQANCRTLNMSKKLKIIENEKHTVGCEICQETLKEY